jgi:L-alanine-DL-glutamate epimerase-like enolase superfamily enzyme
LETYARLAELPVTIDAYDLEGLRHRASPEFERHTTVVRLEGRGERGVGEDVSYDTGDQRTLQDAGPSLPLAGAFTLAGFSEHLDGFDLFPTGPSQPGYRHYRRWAFEAAALDLALRQAGRSLADALGMTPAPVRFVASMSLGHPPEVARLKSWRQMYPGLRFKLDAGSSWSDELVEHLASTGAVDIVDLKGLYKGTPVDLDPHVELYARVVRAFPDAWIEDPALTSETEPVLAEHRHRITWDAPIHSVDDIRALAFPPRVLNFKPSRFGRLDSLLSAYDYCRTEGIGIYGGGQWELGPGRGQIQYLAALFHPDAPNDVAPGGYNAPRPRPGLPESPLEPRIAPKGFRREVA